MMKSIMFRSVASHRRLGLVLRPSLCSSGNAWMALTQFPEPVAASAPSHGFRVHRISSQTASSAVVEDSAPKKPGRGNMGGKESAGSGEEAGRTAGILLFCSLVGATAGLGTWQAMRYSWKVDLVAARKRKMSQEPVDLPRGSEG